jgi:hypothetical protein
MVTGFEELSVSKIISRPSHELQPPPNRDRTPAFEFVFLGPMNEAGGLVAFCDAIDLLARTLKTAPDLKITFSGNPDTVLNMTSLQFIHSRGMIWDTKSLNWDIQTGMNLEALVEYLSETGRVAVLPAAGHTFGIIERQLLIHKVPLILSTRSPTHDDLPSELKEALTCDPQGKALSHKMIEYLQHGGKLY